MGTTQKTNQQGQFAPAGMQAYNQTQGPFAQTATGYMQQPFSNPFFQTQQQMGTRQAQQLGGQQMGNLAQNMTASGMLGGASSPAGLEMLQNQGRANTGLQAQLGFLNPVQNALQQQNYYSGLASQYRPLQTGQTSTQSTQGLGTWLPQIAGMGLGALSGGMGGGLGNMFGSLFGGQGSPGGFNTSNPQNFAGAFGGPSSMMPAPGAGSASGWYGTGMNSFSPAGGGGGMYGMGGLAGTPQMPPPPQG